MKKSQYQSEMKTSWNSLAEEIEKDIQRNRLEQLFYRLNALIDEMNTLGVPRKMAQDFVKGKLPYHIKFEPRVTRFRNIA